MRLKKGINLHRSIQIINSLKLTHWYQPIFQLETGSILGYEALVRNNKPSYELSPMDIFKQAEQKDCRTTLDCQLLFKAMNSMRHISHNILFLNIFPSTLFEPWFLSWWNMHSTIVSSVVLEISESEPIGDWKTLKTIINKLRDRGVKIALDDMGTGYSFFQHWVELNPDYIKLDRYYAIDLAKNLLKQRILESLIKLFDGTTEVVLEGIETVEDLKIAKLLGVPYAQGFLLGRPYPWEDFFTEEDFQMMCGKTLFRQHEKRWL